MTTLKGSEIRFKNKILFKETGQLSIGKKKIEHMKILNMVIKNKKKLMICLNKRLDIAKERIRKQDYRALEINIIMQHRKIKGRVIWKSLGDIADEI